ncbi:MAG: beta-ketoacyl synthase N-terminal-like domain-containing protein [Cyanobacteria bacterium P01_A01_bin.3]
MTDSASIPISPNAIAIIGMANRFPGAATPAQYWHNISQGVESVIKFSDEQLQASGVSQQMRDRPNYVNAGVVLEDVDLFDADFFGYPPRQAQIMDPQQRLFLELAWEALETAGYNPNLCPYPISLFGGVGVSSYFLYNLFSNPELIGTVGVGQIRHSNRPDNLATRVAYKLNLKGPALTVQTGCSSSLVAVHLACQNLLDRESDIALAGGVCIQLPQSIGYLHQPGGINSPDGHCRTFDAQAAGTIFGSGAGIVVLKRLQDAVEDGDTIYASIRGSATNNDGADKIGYTAPSIEGQAAVVAEAMAVAEVNPSGISYIEAHGTGTALGDPIEVAALTQAFNAGSDPTALTSGSCGLGSVKTNIGHLDVAAGVAGLIKTTLALQHRQLPPSLHYQSPNPAIDFSSSPFYVNTSLKDWDCDNRPRLAGVSSFGIGGTNAHVIVEEAPLPQPSNLSSRSWHVLPLSAKTSAALDAASVQLAEHLENSPELSLADVAYTLQVGRVPFTHKRVVTCQTIPEAIAALKAPNLNPAPPQDSGETHVAFLFPGQGSQHVNMGRDLYSSEPIFRQQIDRCCEFLEPILGLDLRTLLYPEPTLETHATEQLRQTSIAQPAIFVVSYAWSQWWASWGIHPQMAIGHSIGEYVAACLAGVFSLEDALKLVATRGRLMAQMPPGTMVAVPRSASDVESLLVEGTAIAANNAPELCAVAGSPEAIEAFQANLIKQDIDYRPLHTSHAFHTAAVDGVTSEFTAELQTLSLSAPTIPFISNLTGAWVDPAAVITPDYWVQHMRQPVRFTTGVKSLLNSPNTICLEVGPGQTLTTLARKQAAPVHPPVASARHPKQDRSDVAVAFDALGHLWQWGVAVDWQAGHTHEQRHRVPLPTYPFQRQRHWVDMSPQFLQALAGDLSPASPSTEESLKSASLEPAVMGHTEKAASAFSPQIAHSDKTTQSQPQTNDRPPLAAEEMPTSEAEKAIARAWEKVLGISPIGTQANFFTLGGDSVQGIQILSLVRQAGWQVDPAQLFQHQTIAALAAIAIPTQPSQAEQGLVSGSVPLVPKQLHYFKPQPLNPQYWSRSLVLDCGLSLDAELLREAINLCLQRHDALRLSFTQTADGWKSSQAETIADIPFSCRDISHTQETEEERAMQAEVAEIQAGFDLETGPLLHVALFKRGGDRADRLWIVVHELAIDRSSLLVLLEDLLLAYQVLKRGMSVEFRPKTCSFKQWSESLLDLAKAPQIGAESSYWQTVLKSTTAPLPLDRPRGSNLQTSATTVKVAISKHHTQHLLNAARATELDIDALLLSALLLGVGDWTGARSLAADLEASGRELLERTDFSETVGPFSHHFPIKLTAEYDDTPQQVAHKVADTVAAVPKGGAHFGLLQHLAIPTIMSEQREAKPTSPICFNHLGVLVGAEPSADDSSQNKPTLDATTDKIAPAANSLPEREQSSGSKGIPLTVIPHLCVSNRSPEAKRPYLLDIQTYIADGCLYFLWEYSSTIHNRKTILRLAESTAKHLQAVATDINSSVDKSAGEQSTSEQSEKGATTSADSSKSAERSQFNVDPHDRERLLDALRSPQ